MRKFWENLAPRERFLLGILALLAPIAIWRYLGPALTNLANRGAGQVVRVGRVEERAIARQGLVDLNLSALDATRGEYEPERNIFIFGEKKKPPPPPPPPRPAATTKIPRPAPPPPPPPAGPRPPPVDVKLLGIFGPERQRIAVLTDDEGAIIDALVEDVVREKFIVHRIGYESIDLKFVGFPEVEPETLEIGG